MYRDEFSGSHFGDILLSNVSSIGDLLCNLISSDVSRYTPNKRLSKVGRGHQWRERCSTADGPKPMKNMKPAEKRRTGAEDFELLHKTDYDHENGQTPRIYEVNYPQLRKEINKKRSTAKVALGRIKKSQSAKLSLARYFSALKMARAAKRRRQSSSENTQQSSPSQSSKEDNDNQETREKKPTSKPNTEKQNSRRRRRVIKRRNPSRSRRRKGLCKSSRGIRKRARVTYSANSNSVDKSCQFIYVALNNAEKSVSTNDGDDRKSLRNQKSCTGNSEDFQAIIRNKSKKSLACASSYNSYMSMRQEPMV